MKIKFITDDGIDSLEATLTTTHKKHLFDDSPEYFVEYLHDKGWLKESKYEVPDFIMDKNPDYDISDSINICRLYESMKTLPPAVAADKKIWIGLSFTDMWDFIQYRRQEDLHKDKDIDILNSFFFMRGPRRSLYIHCLSRFWWIAHLLYDSTRENPYELCQYFASRAFPSRAMLFSSTNFVSNPDIAKGIIECHFDRFNAGKADGRYPYSDTNKYFNCLGGIKILDAMSREDAYSLANDFLEKNFP